MEQARSTNIKHIKTYRVLHRKDIGEERTFYTGYWPKYICEYMRCNDRPYRTCGSRPLQLFVTAIFVDRSTCNFRGAPVFISGQAASGAHIISGDRSYWIKGEWNGCRKRVGVTAVRGQIMTTAKWKGPGGGRKWKGIKIYPRVIPSCVCSTVMLPTDDGNPTSSTLLTSNHNSRSV